MKYLIMTFIASVILLGCTNEQANTKTTKAKEGVSCLIVTIDGCQYLLTKFQGNSFYAHKGNCNNPIHLYKNHDNN